MVDLAQRSYGSVRSALPNILQRSAIAAVEGIGRASSSLRIDPSFLIVGGQRCGTNSLYEYLSRHPNIGRALPIQEVHYFDINFQRGASWYRSHFPTRMRAAITQWKTGRPLVTGESSPYYMFHPHAPARIAQAHPDMKLLVLLRDPTDRAYSHYRHECQRGIETLGFGEAVEAESERLAGETAKMEQDPAYYSFNHHHFSYVSRGHYVDQLERLYSVFPKENVLPIVSERFFADPEPAYAEVLDFLGLPHHTLKEYSRFNMGRAASFDDRLRARVAERYASSNERLSRLLGVSLPWS